MVDKTVMSLAWRKPLRKKGEQVQTPDHSQTISWRSYIVLSIMLLHFQGIHLMNIAGRMYTDKSKEGVKGKL